MQPTPTEIRLRKNSRMLVVAFNDGSEFSFSFEYLRVHSPSADVVGHGPGQETLQTGKEGVVITSIDPIGHYAVRLVFDDGHNTGLYSWTYLYELGRNMEANWRRYLDRLAAAGYARKKPE
ncbi:MAG: DUF971 domain-containing protein [Gammaproteobacteria bacterium]|nr:DUF971 domain-containing protein [Gammaproteobacteria bacterium]MDH3372380.1 DUF971 domain-containing protein [Gammaproteobacteria bacterium]MDH3409434.1 DUF971 domain-containing protein [Gammaproteobacteria bacterium]MDH3551554.1 DUF971 domain-containing protein [Gammaproteobacteria bacterium]